MDLIDLLPPEILVEILGYLAVDYIEDLDALLSAKPSLIQYIHLCNWRNLVHFRFPYSKDLEVYRNIIPGIDSWYRLYRMLYEYYHQPHRFISRLRNTDILDILKEDRRSEYHDVIKLFTVYIPQYGVNTKMTISKILKIGVVRYIDILQNMGYDTISKVIDAGYFIDNDIFIGCLIFMYDAVPNIYNGNVDNIYPIIYDRNVPYLIRCGIINTFRVYHNIIKDIFTNVYYLDYMCTRLLDLMNDEDLNIRYYKYRFIFECEDGRRCLIDRLRRISHLRYTRNMVAFYISKLNMRVDEIIDIFMINNVDNVRLYLSLRGGRISYLDEYRLEMSKRRLLTDNLIRKINKLRRML